MSIVLLAEPLAHKSGEAAKAGPIGLAVIVLLCVACYFLFKSMSKHMRNVRENFPDPTAAMTPRDDAAAGRSPTSDSGAAQPEHVPPRGEQPPARDA